MVLAGEPLQLRSRPATNGQLSDGDDVKQFCLTLATSQMANTALLIL